MVNWLCGKHCSALKLQKVGLLFSRLVLPSSCTTESDRELSSDVPRSEKQKTLRFICEVSNDANLLTDCSIKLHYLMKRKSINSMHRKGCDVELSSSLADASHLVVQD